MLAFFQLKKIGLAVLIGYFFKLPPAVIRECKLCRLEKRGLAVNCKAAVGIAVEYVILAVINRYCVKSVLGNVNFPIKLVAHIRPITAAYIVYFLVIRICGVYVGVVLSDLAPKSAEDFLFALSPQ